MRLFIFILFCLFAFSTNAKDFAPITGRASVIDGDTVEIHGERIRIWGVDAPESRQTCKDAFGAVYRCGKISAFALADWLDLSQPVRCEPRYKDRYRRFVARCFRSSGEDIAEWLARNGYALDWPKYSNGFYAVPQNEAQQAKIGIWQGGFVEPWKFRTKK